MRIFRLILTTAAFFVDVHVHAGTTAIEVPDGCWAGSHGECAVSGDLYEFELSSDSGKFYLQKDTILLRGEDKKFSLIKGVVFVDASDVTTFKMGLHTFTFEGSILLERKQDAFLLSVLSGKGEVKLYKEEKSVVLPEGFQAHVRQMKMEIPQVINVPNLLPVWLSLVARTKPDFRDDIETFKSSWGQAMGTGSDWHATLMKREIAAEAERDRVREAYRLRTERENRELREMFRRKTFQ